MATDQELEAIAEQASDAMWNILRPNTLEWSPVAERALNVPAGVVPQTFNVALWAAKGGAVTPAEAGEILARIAIDLGLNRVLDAEARPRRKDGIIVVHVQGWRE